jgi:predicted TIM-barrel fold metal-dependent hydrolase
VKIAVNNSFAVRKAGGEPERFYGLLAERFGPRRIMWGSNYPAHAEAYGDLAARLALARQDLAFLAEEDRDLVLGGNARRLWPALG